VASVFGGWGGDGMLRALKRAAAALRPTTRPVVDFFGRWKQGRGRGRCRCGAVSVDVGVGYASRLRWGFRERGVCGRQGRSAGPDGPTADLIGLVCGREPCRLSMRRSRYGDMWCSSFDGAASESEAGP